MVAKKLVVACISNAKLKAKLTKALQESCNLFFFGDDDFLSVSQISRASLCIVDDIFFRNGGMEFFKRIREQYPMVGRGIVARRMSFREMTEAVNQNHIYFLLPAELSVEELAKEVLRYLGEREENIERLSKTHEYELLKSEKENLIDAFNHEVRNTIAPISISLRAIKREYTSPKALEVFQRIDNKLLRLSKIMDRLNIFQSLEKGKYFFKVEEVNLSERIESCISMATFFIKEEERKVTITSDIPPGRTIIFDDLTFSLTLEEILQNAIKYTVDNSSIHVSLEEEETAYRIVVQDKGIGLNRKDIASAWEVGYEGIKQENRSSGYYKFRSSGVGLGLSLVRKYLMILGCDSKIESKGRCPAVPVCVPDECPFAGKEGSQCNEAIRIGCKYICPGDTGKCGIIQNELAGGWCPGSKVTIILPR